MVSNCEHFHMTLKQEAKKNKCLGPSLFLASPKDDNQRRKRSHNIFKTVVKQKRQNKRNQFEVCIAFLNQSVLVFGRQHNEGLSLSQKPNSRNPVCVQVSRTSCRPSIASYTLFGGRGPVSSSCHRSSSFDCLFLFYVRSLISRTASVGDSCY